MVLYGRGRFAGSREKEGDAGRREIQGFGSWVADRRPTGLRDYLVRAETGATEPRDL